MDDWKLRLKQSRERKNLNKTEFARRAGISNATATDWEKSSDEGGIKELSASSLIKIHDALEVDLYWLLSGKRSSAEPPAEATQDSPPNTAQGKRNEPHLAAVPNDDPDAPISLQWVKQKESDLLTTFRSCDRFIQEQILVLVSGMAGKPAGTPTRNEAQSDRSPPGKSIR